MERFRRWIRAVNACLGRWQAEHEEMIYEEGLEAAPDAQSAAGDAMSLSLAEVPRAPPSSTRSIDIRITYP